MKLQKHYNYWHQWLFLSLSSLRNFKVKQISSFAHWVMQRKDYLPNLLTLKTNNITGTWQLDTSTDFCSGTYVPIPKIRWAVHQQNRKAGFFPIVASISTFYFPQRCLASQKANACWLVRSQHAPAGRSRASTSFCLILIQNGDR